MQNKEADVKWDFFRVYKENLKTKKKEYADNLHYGLIKLQEKHNNDKSYSRKNVGGLDLRFEKLNYDEIDELWEIQLLTFREHILPGTVNSEDEYNPIIVGKDEELAEFNTIIYDKKNYTLLLHRNRNASTRSRLENYLNILNSKKECLITLEPIILNNALLRIKKPGVIMRSLDVKVDVDQVTDKDTFMYNLVGNARRFGSKTYTVRMSMDHFKKDMSLNNEEIIEMVNNVYGEEFVKGFKLGIRDTIDSEIDIIDLIQNKLVSGYTIEYSKENPVVHDDIYRVCKFDFIRNHREQHPVKIKV